MKKYLLIFILLLILDSCIPRSEKSNFINFDPSSIKCTSSIKCNSEGLPLDSTVMYFPLQLFHDTIPCISDGDRIIRSYYYKNKEEYSKNFNVDIKTLKDTFEIAEDTFGLKLRSFTLFKMHEPILYNHYLKREMYRLISLRAFNRPLLVRLERNKDSITLYVKRLNKHVMFPFIVYGGLDSLAYTTPDIEKYDSIKKKYIIVDTIKYHKLLMKARAENDSISKIYNVIDYQLTDDYQKTITSRTWDSINTFIDSSKFWTTKPNVALDYLQIDGSQWIFEGHSKDGYQLKIIPSPHFENYNYDNIFDENNYYAKLFKFIFISAGLKNERFY
jgi:hypothetical protein